MSRLGKAIAKAGPDDRRRKRGPTPGAGRKPVLPTEDDRLKVRMGIMAGMSIERIARAIDRSAEWVTKHFTDEIEGGADKCGLMVAGRMYRNAMDPNKERSTIYYMEARMGWTAKPPPVDINHTITIKSYPGDEGL